MILTQIPIPHLKWYEDAVPTASRWCPDVRAIEEASEAFQYALSQAEPNEGILLLGTQMFLGTALTFWDVDTCRVW
jgi:hypothetical protein